MGIKTTTPEFAPGQSLLTKRERFHLAYCMVGRTFQFLTARSDRVPARQVVALAACTVGDGLSALFLKRSDRFAFLPRLTINAIDSALWSQTETGLDLATISGVPLAIESGLRMGLGGLIVPVVNAAATGTVRRALGRPASTRSFRYQVMGAVLGAGIASYEANRRQVALARHQRDLEARIGAAHLAGQNSIAAGADTVVDLLSRTTPLLSSPVGSLALNGMLADWRQSLAASTAEHATYLGVTLAKWRRRYNDSHSDLRIDVSFAIEEGHGTVLLSSQQAAWLEGALDQLSLSGSIAVTLVDIDEARLPNRPCRLLVGEHLLEIPEGTWSGLVPFDVGPLGFLAASMWCADTLMPGGCEPNPWGVGAVVASGPLLATWAHRAVGRRGEAAHGKVLYAALLQALAHAAVSTGTMKNTNNPEGIQRFPFLDGLNMVAMMMPLYWGDLEPSEKVLAIVGVVAVLTLGLALFPDRIDWVHLIAELLWPAAAFYSMSTVRTQLAADAEVLQTGLEEGDRSVLANAFAEGRSYVLGLASETRYEARREFIRVGSVMDDRMKAEVERRLTEVDRRLEELSCEDG